MRPGLTAVDAGILNAVFDLLQETGHAHHEELVEIGAEDGEKLHALEQRIARIASFFENAALKLKQAQLGIQVERGTIELRAKAGLPSVRSGAGAGAFGPPVTTLSWADICQSYRETFLSQNVLWAGTA